MLLSTFILPYTTKKLQFFLINKKIILFPVCTFNFKLTKIKQKLILTFKLMKLATTQEP